MELDKTTLNDLSIFTADEEHSLFHKLNLARTVGGRGKLRENFSHSLPGVPEIISIQKIIALIHGRRSSWPLQISNGSMMVIHKFYESVIDNIPNNSSSSGAYAYKLFHRPDFSLVRYSVEHCFDFIAGMKTIIELFPGKKPLPMEKLTRRAFDIMDKPQFKVIGQKKKSSDLTIAEMLNLANFLLYNYKQNMFELIEIFYQFDAWYAMAMAMEKYDLVFPEFTEDKLPNLQAEGLRHLLLSDPVAYDVTLDLNKNFMFLTGANMAGKSTFIKSVGSAVFLAHLGMGVPARSMKLTLFDGLLSNINVVDDISKGESYFFNEVQRIKNTILKINDGRRWLILIDELFKGTNVLDAMKCSTAVIEGLLKIRSSLFILSTHLYEIGEQLSVSPNISFKYFETLVNEDELSFSYQLKEGISNDRIGYLILKREKILELLQNLNGKD